MPNADTLQRLASLHRRAQAHTIAVSYRLCTMMSYITPGAETRVVGRERGAGAGTGNTSQPCLSVCLSVCQCVLDDIFGNSRPNVADYCAYYL